MASSVQGGYFPIYPVQDLLPDPEIRTFITNFYRISDKQDSNELWVSHFTEDSQVAMGNDTGRGHQGAQLDPTTWAMAGTATDYL
jgi:hypothetical protein